MIDDLNQVLLMAGSSVTFEDRDDLLKKLDDLSRPVPARHEGRGLDHREHFCIVRYLRFLAGEEQGLLPLPVTLWKPLRGHDPPDFVLQWSKEDKKDKETFEVTEGSTQDFQKQLSLKSRKKERLDRPVDDQAPTRQATVRWAEILFEAFSRKARMLEDGRFAIDHLLIYDLTGLSLLVPLEDGHALLRAKIEAWYKSEQPRYRFGRVSVLRDQALLFDVCADSRILRGGSPYFHLSVIRASDADDLRQRLRALDQYCRQNSIRHLKLFGSILGDLEKEASADADHAAAKESHFFRSDSDLDLLVEFEPGTPVTFLDMARMERELTELTGFKVDLRTAGDLSRHFRQEVLNEAVGIHAQSA